MIFAPTELDGVFVITIEPIEDDRGFFARTWCAREFAEHDLNVAFVQENVGFNHRKGTLRGLHFQIAPHDEVKLVRCTHGAVWDVAVDLREGSRTFGKWVGTDLSAENHAMLYVPRGCAHGYITLTEGAEVRYLTSAFYAPESSRGARYDDPTFGIEWPTAVERVSEQDRSWPLWEAAGVQENAG